MSAKDTATLMKEHIERAEKFIAQDEELRKRSPGIGLNYAVLVMEGLLTVIADLQGTVKELEGYLDRNGL